MVISTRPKSYLVTFDPDPPRGQPKTIEHDVMRCSHCDYQTRIPKNGLHDVGDLCRQCFEFICVSCTKKYAIDGKCAPLEKRLQEMEASGEARRSYGI